jgi:hypothetical protein
MTTSGSYDFELDRDELITQAYQYIGAVDIRSAPTTTELTDGGKVLNMMLKGWQTENIYLWLNKKVTLFLEADKETYLLGPSGDNFTATSEVVKTEMKVAGVATDATITVDSITDIDDGDYIGIELDDGTTQWTTVNGDPATYIVTLTTALTSAAAINNYVSTYTTKAQRPLEIIEARSVSASDNEIPLIMISREEYMDLSDKSSNGVVTQFWYDPQLTNGRLSVWPTSDDPQNKIKATIKYPIMDMDASGDTGEFPPEWTDAIVLNLAVRIAIKTGVPIPKELKELAGQTKFLASTFDREQASTFFQPNLER